MKKTTVKGINVINKATGGRYGAVKVSTKTKKKK